MAEKLEVSVLWKQDNQAMPGKQDYKRKKKGFQLAKFLKLNMGHLFQI